MNLEGYVPAHVRLGQALAKFPDLRIVEHPTEIVTVGQVIYLAAKVTVYRTPDDPIPTTATAWEPWPGKTPFTRDSEMMNAATSALGRALGYMGFGIAQALATVEEVKARQSDREAPPRRPRDETPTEVHTNKRLGAPSEYSDPTDRQLDVIRRMCAERGVERDEPTTQAEASALITELKALPLVK